MDLRGVVEEPVAGPRQGDTASRDGFALLSAAWAVAVVLDQLWWGGFEVWSLHAVVVLAAGWALLGPRSVARFSIMAAAVVVSVAADLPAVGTHRLLELLVAGFALAQIGWRTARQRRLPVPGAAFEQLAPFLRVALLVVYGFAALSKMNTGFLDPAVSCAGPLSQQIVWFDPGVLSGPWLVAPAIWSTVAIEAALPVLLALRRLRPLGVILGLGFHTVLGFAGNVPFTAVALALYVTFLPPRALTTPRGLGPAGRWRRVPATGPVVLLALVAAWAVGAHVGPSGSFPGLAGAPSAAVSPVLGTVTRVLAALLALALAALLVLGLRPGTPRPPYPRGSLRVRPPILLVGVLVLLVNGACPYLGLKTDTSFEMFSNLRTEPGAWNTVVVPERVRVFGYQDQLLTVVDSTDPALVARTAGGTRIVALELDRALRAHPGARATYVRDGDPTPRTVGPLPPGPTLAERLATFRDVPPAGRPRC